MSAMSTATILDSSVVERQVNEGRHRLSDLFDQCGAFEEPTTMEVTVGRKKRGRKRRLSNLFNIPGPAQDTDLSNSVDTEAAAPGSSLTYTETSETNGLCEDPSENNSASGSPVEENSEEATVGPRRSQRKKIRTSLPEQYNVVTKSVKLHQNSSLKDIKNYYLDRRVKRLNPSLETIFEEPHVVNNEDVVMSSRKFKRLIDFNSAAAKNNAAKVRKRKAKAKSVKNRAKAKKVSMKFLMEKLDEIEQDS